MLLPRVPRRGLKRIEVVLVLAVCLVVFGLLVVALPRWWANSARVHCLEHLKEIGMAVDRYDSDFKRLPASRLEKGYATWAVQLAPYLPGGEASPLTQWDMAKSYYAQPEPVRKAHLVAFYCPARRAQPQHSTAGDVPAGAAPDAANVPGALGDYACSAGDGAADWDSTDANGAIIPAKVIKMDGDRLLKWEALTDLESLPRGKSATILVGEKHIPLGQLGQAAAGDGSLYNGDHTASFARLGGPGFGLAQSPSDPLNKNFGSYHLDVCHFLFADASARPLFNTISPEVLGQLTNRMKSD